MITIMAHMMGAAISAPKIALTQSNLLMLFSFIWWNYFKVTHWAITLVTHVRIVPISPASGVEDRACSDEAYVLG